MLQGKVLRCAGGRQGFGRRNGGDVVGGRLAEVGEGQERKDAKEASGKRKSRRKCSGNTSRSDNGVLQCNTVPWRVGQGNVAGRSSQQTTPQTTGTAVPSVPAKSDVTCPRDNSRPTRHSHWASAVLKHCKLNY